MKAILYIIFLPIILPVYLIIGTLQVIGAVLSFFDIFNFFSKK